MPEVKRALVLGGGGVIGVAWETGVIAGLYEKGIDLREVDVIVGTSAGAITGAQLAAGRLPNLEQAKPREGVKVPVDRGKLDLQVLGDVFRTWAAMKHSDPVQIAAIGKLAVTVGRGTQDAWIDQISRGMKVESWPEKPLLINIVDVATGERRVIDRDSGVEIQRVVAGSSAVPGMCPSIAIQGRLYMDGQVHSSTNADVLLSWKPQDVWIAMPTNKVTGQGIGPHAENMLEREVAALRAAGSKVSVVMPGADDSPRLGRNLMDPTRAPDAYQVGLEAGRRWADELIHLS